MRVFCFFSASFLILRAYKTICFKLCSSFIFSIFFFRFCKSMWHIKCGKCYNCTASTHFICITSALTHTQIFVTINNKQHCCSTPRCMCVSALVQPCCMSKCSTSLSNDYYQHACCFCCCFFFFFNIFLLVVGFTFPFFNSNFSRKTFFRFKYFIVGDHEHQSL